MKKVRVVTITPTLETSAYAANDVLFNPTEIDIAQAPTAFGNVPTSAVLRSVVMVNYDDTAIDVDLYFFKKNTNDLGTVNDVIDITEAELKENGFLGVVSMDNAMGTANDFFDLLSARTQTELGINLPIQSDSGKIYVAGVIRGAQTFAADDIELSFGFDECGQA